MGVFSFPAVAIYDSTATGRSLITAADQAAARAAIGVDTSEYGFLDSDNTWTGDNTFDEPIAASEFAGVSSLTLSAAGGNPAYFKFGSTLSWIVDAATIRPTDSLGSRDIGLYNRRIGDVMAFRFGATERFRLFNLGDENETNTEYLETSYNSTFNYFQINSAASGTGTVRDIRISRDSDEGIWIDQSGIRFLSAGSSRFVVTSGEIRLYKYLRSMNSAATIGSTTYPFPAAYSDLFSAGDGDTGTATPSIGFTNSPNMGFARASINQMNFIIDAARRGINIGRDNFGLTSNYALGWRSASSLSSGTHDLTLHRDAAHTLAQRFGTNPQAFRVYGTWTDASNGEWLQMDYGVSNAGAATIQAYANGTGANGGLYLRSETSLRLYVGGILAQNISSTVDRFNVHIEPYFDNQKRAGSSTKRFTEVWSYDANFIGTTTLRTFDDGAGNSSSVATQTGSLDSFFLHRSWTGTSGTSSSWIGLKNDYNSSGTAASWIGLSSNTFRLEIANGLRAMWQHAGTQHLLNLHFYPYLDNTWKNGTFNKAWSETWQHSTNTIGSYVDSSNYGYLSIAPSGSTYLIKANSLGTTADASIKIQTSQKSAAGNQAIVLDADYWGTVNFFFGGNNRGSWGKDTLTANVAVLTNNSFTITRTWNTATTVFKGYEANITDTTSDTESSLLNLKVGGTSYLRLRKNGDLLFEKQGGSARIVQNAGGIAILGDNGSTVQAFDQYFNYTYKTFRPVSDNQHLGYVSRRFLVKANDIYSKGKIRSYNLGDETEVNAEFLNMYWDADKAYLTVQKDGTGSEREFIVGHHVNGCTRYNNTSNIIRWSISGTTGTKMYLNSNGLTVYGRVDPQGNKTRDLGTDSTARWRVGYMDTCDLDDGRINQKTSSSSDPSTSEYANDGDWGIHENTSNGHIYLAFNDGGTIYKTQLHSGGGGGTPPP